MKERVEVVIDLWLLVERRAGPARGEQREDEFAAIFLADRYLLLSGATAGIHHPKHGILIKISARRLTKAKNIVRHLSIRR